MLGLQTYRGVDELLMKQADVEERLRRERIATAWDYYFGRHPKPLRQKKNEPDHNVIANQCRFIVDKGVAFLFGDAVIFQAGDQRESDADTYLAAVWKQNRCMTLLNDLALNGGVTGHAFLKMVLPMPGQEYPRIVAIDPGTVSVLWDVDDYTHVEQYTIQWNAIDPATGRPVARRQRITRTPPRWVITDEISRADNPNWRETGRQVWPYAWEPIFHCKNLPAPNSFWGVSDLEGDVRGMNDAINFNLSNIVRILYYHAHPKTWGRGFFADQIDTSVDSIIALASETATLQNLEMQSDLGSSLDMHARLKEALHEVARVPEIASGKVENLGSLSGVALRVLYQPLIEKTQTKRRLYGDMLVDLNQRLLELGGYQEEVSVVWPDILPRNPLEEAEAGIREEEMGVSRHTALRQRGFDPEREAALRKAEQEEEMEKQRAAFDRGMMPLA